MKEKNILVKKKRTNGIKFQMKKANGYKKKAIQLLKQYTKVKDIAQKKLQIQ